MICAGPRGQPSWSSGKRISSAASTGKRHTGVGRGVGTRVAVGKAVGLAEGALLGVMDGKSVAVAEGAAVMVAEGTAVNVAEGAGANVWVGATVGGALGSIATVTGLAGGPVMGCRMPQQPEAPHRVARSKPNRATRARM